MPDTAATGRTAITGLEQLRAQAQLYGFRITAAPGRTNLEMQHLLSRPQEGTDIALYRGALPQLRAHLKMLQFARDWLLCP